MLCTLLRRSHAEPVDVEADHATAVALARFAAGMFHEDPAHRLGRGAEEMTAVLPLLLFLPKQPKVSFVDQSGRLQGVAWLLTGLEKAVLRPSLLGPRA